MVGWRSNRLVIRVGLLTLALGLAACARWRGGPAPGEVAPRSTSFDDLLPDGITTIVYLPNVPQAKERFRATDLSKRLGEQAARGLWRRVDFLRPWVEVAFRQITDQVDEVAWGACRAGERDDWFLVARLNQPARRVLERLHERTLPRVAEDLRPLGLSSRRYRGRRIYEWVKREGGGARTLVTYALVGQVIVMGSNAGFVRRAIEQRPLWFQRGPWGGGGVRTQGGGESLKIAMTDLERDDDLYLWSRIESNAAGVGETTASPLSRVANRLTQILASNLRAASAGFQIAAPTITGRWRLELAHPPNRGRPSQAPFHFASIVPSSARTFAAIHGLPLDHPVFSELRAVLAKAIAAGAFAQLKDALGVLRLIPGIGDLPRIVASLEGQVAYCSFPSAETSRTERCVMIALEDPMAVASGLRAAGLLLPPATKEEYRGRPMLRVGVGKAALESGIVLAVVNGALIIATRAEVVRGLVDAIETTETLDRRAIVARLQRYRHSDDLVAEFYSAPATAGAQDGAPSIFNDRRLGDLAAGGAYSICLQRPRGVEIVTCSATGFHWSSATLGAAAIALRSPLVAALVRRGE